MSRVDSKLEKQLDLLAERVNTTIYNQRKYMLGRILTIIEAVTNDPEQRKAIKDVIQDLYHQGSYWNDISWHFDELKKANGIKPKEDTALLSISELNIYEEV